MTSHGPSPDSNTGIAAAIDAFAPIADAVQETAVFAYFDPEWRLLGMRQIAADRVDAISIPLATVLADAATLECVAVVMAHNHPSGDPSPSAADYVLTRKVARTLDGISVRLIDHIVLAPGGCESFRERGLL